MKKLVITSILALLLTGGSAMGAQEWPDEYLGLPGDNLNLYAVMKLFQESETLEGFERKLNDENSRINNLDLNRDNMVDYITVSDYVDGNMHTIVLRVALSRNENQDVAVFTVEQMRNGEVRIQLIGDEALYGKNYIIEPNYAETPNPGYLGNRPVTVVTTTYYDVAYWPVVRFIFHPAYVVWRSLWYWGFYPDYWYPWRPWYWHYYYGYHYHWYPHYYHHYHHTHHHHYTHYHSHYYTHIRHHSPVVSSRIQAGSYRSTYSRPEQRREGEALYARTNPQRNVNNATANVERRTGAQSSQSPRAATGNTVTQRRSTETTAQSTRTGSTAGQNANTTRRVTSTPTERSTINRSSDQRVTSTGRSSNPATGRAASTPATTQRTTTTQRSTSAQVNRSASAPSVNQRSSTSRSSSSSVSQRTPSRSSATVNRTSPSRSSGSSVNRSVSRSSSSSNRSSGNVSRSSSSSSSSRSAGTRSPGSGSAHRR
ncbi:MAG: hypothetical protein JW973_14955 [Bacteroidales bacterium]|nr:hypothetical protein [Bacteroidales bacterium]